MQKYYVYNAPYTAAVTGEDVADIIDKLRSEYQKGHAAATGAEHASDDEGSDDDILAARPILTTSAAALCVRLQTL